MKLITGRSFVAAGALTAASLVYAAPAAAQATRTWVSGVGDDVNPCSRTAPCKTFAGAISKTAAGGEINCLDQGAYGTVTIVKSITLSCVGVTAGVLHSATNGIVINAAATDRVVLKGLDINGAPPTAPGLNGIRFISGASLTVEDTVIHGSGGAAPNGYGILFQPSAYATLQLTNVTITTSGSGTSGGGLLVQPTGTGTARVVINASQIVNNAGTGVRVDTTGNTGAENRVAINNSVISGNVDGIAIVGPGGTKIARVSTTATTVAFNTSTGISATGGNAQARTSGTLITGNGSSLAGNGGLVSTSGGSLLTYGDNVLFGNFPDGNFTGVTGKN